MAVTDSQGDEIRLPPGALVVLVGASGSGKSTWAADELGPGNVVSSDALRAVVGIGPDDQRAGSDAFDVLDLVVERRLRRGLLTVVDTVGLDAERRRRWLEMAAGHGRAAHAVLFDIDPATCRRRNRARSRPVPARVLSSQLARLPDVADELAAEPFAAVHPPGPARVIAPTLLAAGEPTDRREEPVPLRFGLQIPRFDFADTDELAPGLARIAAAAEEAGFSSIWVMDHLQQIPQVGRAWEPMLESYTTLGFLAAHTSRATLGTMVTGITYRNVAHLGKIVATLDVLSGGRAVCGIGAAWFEQEHRDYGWRFPPIGERYELLEDALELLPLLWGPGQPAYEGRLISVPAAICYPRPVQEHVPILVGGSGERRTLRLVARHADACNLFGEPEVVRHKVSVLHEHCRSEERDPSEIAVTQLGTVLVAGGADDVVRRVRALTPAGVSEHDVVTRYAAGTVDDHVARFRDLAAAGADEVIVSIPDIAEPGAIEAMGEVIDRLA